MKRVLPLLGTALAVGALASPASAANQVVVGNDLPAWDKPIVSVLPGETVTWTFPGTIQVHHVASEGSDVGDAAWASFNSPLAVPAPDAQFTFTTPGRYAFVCTVHRDTMRGTVVVGTDPLPPPAPLPPSQQPWLNTDTSEVAPERNVREDTRKPKLSRVSVRRAGSRAVRVRFRVSEEATVRVRLRRGGKTIKAATVEGTGTRSVTVRGAKRGRYRVEVRATDIAGNRSSITRTRVTVR